MRLTVAVAAFISPAVQRPITEGSSEPLFALLMVVALCCLIHWWETEDLRSLAYLAIALSLAMATGYHAVALLAGALVFVIAHLALHRHRKSYAEATLIIFLTLALYAAALWVTANWLIMGDPVFFLRGLLTRAGTWKDRLAFLADGCEWKLLLILCVIVFMGWGLGKLQHYRRSVWTGLGAAAACALLWAGSYRSITFSTPPVEAEMTEVSIALRTAYQGDWVVVSGYRGYALTRLLPEEGKDCLQHTLSFCLDEVLEKTLGRRAYLLVPAARGVDCWEDIHLSYPGVFDYGTNFTVFERSWRDWRLWCIVPVEAELWR